MTLTDQVKNADFISYAKEQRQWLSSELSNLDPRSEDYKSKQWAIAVHRELDKVIGTRLRRRRRRLAPMKFACVEETARASRLLGIWWRLKTIPVHDVTTTSATPVSEQR